MSETHLGWDAGLIIYRDIHPLAVLSQTYFENMFCLTSYSDVSRSEVGLKVALGDSSMFLELGLF